MATKKETQDESTHSSQGTKKVACVLLTYLFFARAAPPLCI